MTTKKRFAAYGMAATAAIGGGIGGLAIGMGVPAGQVDLATELAAASTVEAIPVHMGGGGVGRVDHLTVVAEALGMPAEELRSALQGGRPIAEIAAERNVDVQKVIDALVAAHTATIDRAVADGRLTQAQADERKAGLAARVKARIERTGPHGPGKGGHGHGRGGGHVHGLAVASSALGMSPGDLRTALAGGRSIAQVAAERNVDVQKVIDALVAAHTATIDQAVADGRLTQAQADERKAGLTGRVRAHVERVGLRGPGGPVKGDRGPGRTSVGPGGTAATPSSVVVS